jgi:hypothetical protein
MNGNGMFSPEKLAEGLIGRRISQTMFIEHASEMLNNAIFLILSEFATSRGEKMAVLVMICALTVRGPIDSGE